MRAVLRILLALIAGAVLGSIVNMFFITISGKIIPPPAGAIITTTEGLQASMHLFEPKHFLFPFLAHALGTLTGAGIAARITPHYQMPIAYGIGCLFLAGGIASAIMLPAPRWFILTDLCLAYLPMAFLAGKWMQGRRIPPSPSNHVR